MAERRTPAGSSAHRTITVFGDHRANDVIVGHVGRVSYRPVADDDDDAAVGVLSVNRVASNGVLLLSTSDGDATNRA